MISPVKVWRRQKEIKKILGKVGRIITWTKIYVASDEFKNGAPYAVILVELDHGDKIVGQLVDYEEKDLRMGTKVYSTLRKTKEGTKEDIIAYGIKFRVGHV